MPEPACVVDSHTWAWHVTGEPKRIGRAARRVLEHSATAYIPAICQWEIAMTIDAGGFHSDRPIAAWLEQATATPPFALAPLTAEVAAAAVELGREGFHGDPADRMIYATARVLDLPLLTADTSMRAFDHALPKARGRRVVWD